MHINMLEIYYYVHKIIWYALWLYLHYVYSWIDWDNPQACVKWEVRKLDSQIVRKSNHLTVGHLEGQTIRLKGVKKSTFRKIIRTADHSEDSPLDSQTIKSQKTESSDQTKIRLLKKSDPSPMDIQTSIKSDQWILPTNIRSTRYLAGDR